MEQWVAFSAVKDHQTRIQDLVVKESALIGKLCSKHSPLSVLWWQPETDVAEQLQLQKRGYVKLATHNTALSQKIVAKDRELQAAIAGRDERYVVGPCFYDTMILQ